MKALAFRASVYVQGTAWDSYADNYDSLFQKLESVVNKIHAAGVVHNNFYQGKMLVTPDDRVIIRDFAHAILDPTPEYLKAEKNEICTI